VRSKPLEGKYLPGKGKFLPGGLIAPERLMA